MRQITALLLVLICVLSLAPAQAEESTFTHSGPDVLRPGKLYNFHVNAPAKGVLTMVLVDGNGHSAHTVVLDFPLEAGDNTVPWDGLRGDGSAIEAGDYSLRFRFNDMMKETPLRIGAPYPLLSNVQQSHAMITDNVLDISFEPSTAGSVEILLYDVAAGTQAQLDKFHVNEGLATFQWDGVYKGTRVPDGQYRLGMTLYADNGMESMQHMLGVKVATGDNIGHGSGSASVASLSAPADMTGEIEPKTEETPEAEAEPAATEEPASAVSQPYSDAADGTFWSMTPGELDDAVIWDIMMQPITVYDGKLDQRDHVYLMENPDGTGGKIAQIHAQSQGLHILGEPNEHGYVLAEAFSSYDNYYFPESKEEKEHTFDVKRGYIEAKGLKEVKVQQDMGLLIDKLSQRMYLFVDGKRVTEFLICTGLIEGDKYWNETTSGEFITVSHTGGFSSNKYMYCDMAIRINGGILLHEVPYEPLGDGSKRYTNFEAVLGQKASHGCIRIQRTLTPEGYNHAWLWENLKPGAPYKVIVWDDLNRVDTPVTWQSNPS